MRHLRSAIPPTAAAALCLGLLSPAARAQPIDQQSAQQLQQDLQSWFAPLLGPTPDTPRQAPRVTAEADHLRVVLPFADASGRNEATADVRPLDGGRWSVDALRLPESTHFRLEVPEPGGPPGARIPTSLTVHIGSQANHAVLDPAFASPSRLDIDLRDVGLVTDNARQHDEQHIERYTIQTELQPHDGRLDLVQQGSIVGWNSASQAGDKPATGFGADRIAASGRIDGIDREHATALLTAASGLIATLPPAAAIQQGEVAMSAPERAAIRTLIGALRGIITGIHGLETIDGLHVAIAGKGEATVRQVRFGIDGAAPDGVLRASLDIGLDGLTVRDLPPPVLALVPTHVVLRPSVAGVPMAELTTLALAATQPGTDPARLSADAEALLAHGGVTVGLDTLELTLGPAEMQGHGQVLLTGGEQYQARARITAKGLDDLMQQARNNPALQQALPFLAMARGFARQEGDRLVWDIIAGKNGVMVNGMELGNPAALAPHPDRR